MIIFYTQDDLRRFLSYNDKTIGFVPTMGALHKGHLSLINKAKEETDIVICSIFVNPTQFNNVEDLINYPTNHHSDINMLESAECDILYLPRNAEDVYSNHKNINLDLGLLSSTMEGANRPGHFEGVINVVSSLFEIIKPNKAFFGLKDFQQYLIIKKITQILSLDIEIIGCPIIREENGLAMSSRNSRLNIKEKNDATIIYETLNHFKKNCYCGDIKPLIKKCLIMLSSKSKPEYLKVVEEDSLKEVSYIETNKKYRVFVVSHIGDVRLIDNIEIFI